MRTNTMLNGLVILALFMGVAAAKAAGTVDIVQDYNAGAGRYFVPTDAQKYDWPFYRWHGDDWGWKHGGIMGATFTSATLSISAFDVDASFGEVDKIRVMMGSTLLGSLAGGNDIWSYTTFNLDVNNAAVVSAINSGLDVSIEIDANNDGWAVTLAKSVLEVDGGSLPPPQPGVPDGGSTMMLLGGAFASLAGLRRRFAR